MTTDRELLEAAAKAAGRDPILWCGPNGWLCETMNGAQRYYWNPLRDDGDALRLAVALNIGVQCHVYQGSGYVLAQCGQGSNDAHAITIAPGDDPAAATRRAIVRAAAEMAKEPK